MLLIAFVYGVGILIVWRQYMALDAATWYATPSAEGSTLSLAGMWYGYVSLPIFQFLLLRWYFRLFIWARFLWQVSRIELSLVPTHPDRVGGLGFLSDTVYAFVPARGGARRAAGRNARQPHFLPRRRPAGVQGRDRRHGHLSCCAWCSARCWCSRRSWRRRSGRALREYGTLAQRYVREFDAKWLRGGAPADEPLRGERRHPVPRRSGQQLSRWCGPCASRR
ncbi:MAG: hypothetical protein M0C28_16690 [Candidatus Moduliflexus flocculans]|nr:hypothetical protein [Candidatus Moduliflexus flocculans]